MQGVPKGQRLAVGRTYRQRHRAAAFGERSPGCAERPLRALHLGAGAKSVVYTRQIDARLFKCLGRRPHLPVVLRSRQHLPEFRNHGVGRRLL